MITGQGVIVGVLGRYASDPSQPFPPHLETVNVTLSDRARASALEALQAAWEATLPWSSSEELQQKAEEWLRRALLLAGHSDVEVQVTVMDDLPHQVRP